MVRKIRTQKTAEQRREEAAALHKSISEQVEKLQSSEGWKKFITFASNFHNYSTNNLFLIMSQCEHATAVAGFRQWQKMGRQVRKGEKSIKIFGYAELKIKPTEPTEDTDEKEDRENSEAKTKKLPYFPILSVFDISQTDPIDPNSGQDEPEPLAKKLTGDDPLGIYNATADYITKKGWSLYREKIGHDINGYTKPDTHKIVIDSNLAPAQAAKTLLHETAHALMHASDDYEEYITHRGTKECEAESVAYITAGLLGLDTSDYSIGYIAKTPPKKS